jgi:hypothetical protein
MGNLFDSVRDVAFDLTTNVFGKVAYWTPSAGGAQQNCGVHFNDPDSVKKLGDIEYLPTNTTVEYRKPNFPTLKESVDAGNNETLIIEGVTFYVGAVKAVEDGSTLIAVLEKTN